MGMEGYMSVEGLEKMNEVKLPKVSQIGIVVPDIGKAVRYYSKIPEYQTMVPVEDSVKRCRFQGRVLFSRA